MLPSWNAASHVVRGTDEDVDFLRQRVRAILWVILLSNLSFAAGDILLERDRWAILAIPKLANVAGVLAALPLLRRSRSWVIATALAVFAGSAIAAAAAGAMTAEFAPTVVLCTTAAMVTASLVPWGVRPQLLLVVALAATMTALIYEVAPELLSLSYVTIAVAVALVLSAYVAHQIDRHRRSMQEAVAAADAANNVKSAFLAAMSHEVRNPIGIVIGMTELLLDTHLSPQQHDYVSSIRTSGETLLNLVNDILDFSKIEAGRIEIEPHDGDLVDLVSGVVDLFREAARLQQDELALDIAADVPRRLRGDFPRLRQVLSNLVGNAVKFTRNGRVNVRVRLAGCSPERVRIRFEIEDTGIGIAPEALASIFDIFVQATASTARDYGGTGLGLAICKRLTEVMGGEISVDSAPGRGSCFSVTIPLEVAAPASPSMAVSEPLLRTPAFNRALVADDDPVNSAVLIGLLAQLNIGADGVGNGREAVAAVTRSPYAFVLMDCSMPVMDGLEATREIRRRERRDGGHVPIIAVTATAGLDDRRRCETAGMDHYLTKPIRRYDLERVLADYVTITAQPDTAHDADNTLDLVLERFGGDVNLLASIAAVFLGESPELLARVEDAVERGTEDDLRRAAHRLKSAVANFVPHPALERVRQLEAMARKGDRDACRAIVPAVVTEIGRLRATLALCRSVDNAPSHQR